MAHPVYNPVHTAVPVKHILAHPSSRHMPTLSED